MEKIKELHLKYNEKDFEKLKKLKEKRGLTWEEFIYLAIVNL